MILQKNKLSRTAVTASQNYPIKVVQFGEGNFLRAFVDYAFHTLNQEVGFNAGVAVVQPLAGGMVHRILEQDGLFTVFLNGVKKGENIQEVSLVTNIVAGVNPYTEFDAFLQLAREEQLEFVISNTTEAGIEFVDTDTYDMAPPQSFPAKLLRLLYERYVYFCGDESKGLTIIPCELINYNADTLKSILLQYARLWNLSDNFQKWVAEHCTYHNTLVDRIVPGYPKDTIEMYNAQLDYQDDLIVTAEPFFLWVIEGGEALKAKLPFHKTALDVKIVEDMQPYRTRKVRILNGAHTAMVPFSMLYGHETVQQAIEDSFTGSFVHSIVYDEINRTLTMDPEELQQFADEVLDRFRNPYIRHLLADISLNSISKFKVRVLPSILEYIKRFDEVPRGLAFSFACLIRFYQGDWQGKSIKLQDSKEVVDAFEHYWQMSSLEETLTSIFANTSFWGEDLNAVDGLYDTVLSALRSIEELGIEDGYASFSQR
jgi:tagaturonate reductase